MGAIFATEKRKSDDTEKLFYSPYLKATKSHNAVNTNGVLYEKYMNFRQKLISYKVISKEACLKEGL